ncbi:MAG: hypothetical protein ACOYD7_00665 [Raoultibacter sp.]|jgi:PAS domain-containing protein
MTDYAKIEAAYDNSPVATLLLKGVLAENKTVDLEVYYANALAARLWGVTPELLRGMHLLAADENASKDWLDIYQVVQANHKKRSFYFYSDFLGKNFKVDCFYYGPQVTGCYIRTAEYEVGRGFNLDASEDNRPLSDLEKDFSTLVRVFSSPEESTSDIEARNDYVCYTEVDSYKIIDVVANQGSDVESLIGSDFRGKVYYELFDGANEPQGGFKTKTLYVDRYQVWQEYNPVLNKEYLHRAKLVKLDGEYVRLDIAQDITDGKRKAVLLTDTFDGMNLWIECVNILSTEESFQEALHMVLARMSAFFAATAGLICLFGKRKYNATWTKEGTPADQLLFEDPSRAALQEWSELLQNETQFLLTNTTDSRIPERLHAHFEANQIKTIQLFPIYAAARLKGVIVFVNPEKRTSTVSSPI